MHQLLNKFHKRHRSRARGAVAGGNARVQPEKARAEQDDDGGPRRNRGPGGNVGNIAGSGGLETESTRFEIKKNSENQGMSS